MKKEISRKDAIKKIGAFFDKNEFSAFEMRKIKRLAMKYRIRLGDKRKKFCRKCLSMLKGKTRIKENFKIVKCVVCGCANKFKIR